MNLSFPYRPVFLIALLSLALLVPTLPSRAQDRASQKIESDDSRITQIGEWHTQASNNASGGSYRYNTPSSNVERGSGGEVALSLNFAGPSIEILYISGPTLGTLAIEIDGTVLRTVITTTPETAYGQSAKIDYLTDETHELKVYAQAGGVVAIDAFIAAPFVADSGSTEAGVTNVELANNQVGPRACDPSSAVHPISRASGAGGALADFVSEYPALSHDGRYVTFVTSDENLAPSDHDFQDLLYVRDRQTCATILISVSTTGGSANDDSWMPSLSATGRYVAFASQASNLIAGGTTLFSDQIFVRDRDTDNDGIFDEAGASVTTLISRSPGGSVGNGDSFTPVITPDGRYVAFASDAENMVAGDTNLRTDVFVRDLQTNTTIRVSVGNAASAQANEDSGPTSAFPNYAYGLDLSDNGRFIVFESYATNLVTGDTNSTSDIFVRDRDSDNDGVFDEPVSQTTTRLSVSSSGGQSNSVSNEPNISGDGQIVAFQSFASNLVTGDTAMCDGFNCADVFVHNRQTGQTTRVSTGPAGVQSNADSFNVTLSANGRYVAFQSYASNLSTQVDGQCSLFGSTFACAQGFIHDRNSGTTTLMTTASNGAEANQGVRDSFVISPDGVYVAFDSHSSNLNGATNFDQVVYAAPNNSAGPAPDTIAVFRRDLNAVTLLNTLQDLPPLANYSTFVMHPPLANGVQGQWVLGDWNGDLLKSPGVYANGAFHFTNFVGPSESWTSIWIGIDGPPVAGRFSGAAINDCIGAIDDASLPPFGTVYAMYFTCNLGSGPTPALSFQWLSAVLPDSQGHTGAHQFVAGDWNLDLVESIGVRRGTFIAFTNVTPTQLVPGESYSAAEFNLAQFWGVPPVTGGDYGVLVAGDWDSDFDDSFGVFYQNGNFYRRRDVDWNTGEHLLQRIGQPIGTPVTAGSWH